MVELIGIGLAAGVITAVSPWIGRLRNALFESRFDGGVNGYSFTFG
ncbi:MAG TPA: hypothetical protein VFJ93_10570 [Gaiellaceae bacterium]|nr:hypothetical protein [Gaiellaceae bacterium]